MLFPEAHNIDLSISIVSYNVRDLLVKCLRSIIEETKGITYEIIVVDNNSQDGTQQILKEIFPKVRVIVNRRNRGFAAAQNMGLSMGRGRYLFSLDSDTYIKEDTFTSMVRFMDQRPDCGAAGAKLLSPEGDRQYSRRRFPPSIWPVIYRGSFLKYIMPPTKQVRYYEMSDIVVSTATEVDWVYGGNIIFNRKALEQVGLFDERFFLYCEDIDICYRMQEYGWNRCFVPEAKIIHYGQQGTKQIKIRSYLRHIRSYLKLFQKYRWSLDNNPRHNFNRHEIDADILAVLVCRDQKEVLFRCLDKLINHQKGYKFQVIVVDEASSDNIIEYLSRQYPNVFWVSNKKPRGYLGALNQALFMTDAKYLATIPLRPESIYGQFDYLRDFLEQHPKAAIAGLVNDKNKQGSLPEVEINEKVLFSNNCMMVRCSFLKMKSAATVTMPQHDEFEWCQICRKLGLGIYYLFDNPA